MDIMIQDKEVICLHSFEALQPQREHKIGDIERDIVVTNQLIPGEEGSQDAIAPPRDVQKQDDYKHLELHNEHVPHKNILDQNPKYCPWQGQLKQLSSHETMHLCHKIMSIS